MYRTVQYGCTERTGYAFRILTHPVSRRKDSTFQLAPPLFCGIFCGNFLRNSLQKQDEFVPFGFKPMFKSGPCIGAISQPALNAAIQSSRTSRIITLLLSGKSPPRWCRRRCRCRRWWCCRGGRESAAEWLMLGRGGCRSRVDTRTCRTPNLKTFLKLLYPPPIYNELYRMVFLKGMSCPCN